MSYTCINTRGRDWSIQALLLLIGYTCVCVCVKQKSFICTSSTSELMLYYVLLRFILFVYFYICCVESSNCPFFKNLSIPLLCWIVCCPFFFVCPYLCYVESPNCPFLSVLSFVMLNRLTALFVWGIVVTQKASFHLLHLLLITKFFCILYICCCCNFVFVYTCKQNAYAAVNTR